MYTKIFLDGGDPEETREADQILKKAGFKGVEGQTTNPSLIAKNLKSKNKDKKITEHDALEEYKRIVRSMSKITSGPISIQVFANDDTPVDEMLSQARDRVRWIPNAIIKFPCTKNGLAAAEVFSKEGSVNITLVFSQEQSAAVYTATRHRGVSPDDKPYDVFVSPFVGRLDDKGENGMDIIVNTLEMYKALGDGHVKVLTASVRTLSHLLYAIRLKSDMVTVPFKILQTWREQEFKLPDKDYIYDVPGLREIPYRTLTLDSQWWSYDSSHELTDKGVLRFWEDWHSLFDKSE